MGLAHIIRTLVEDRSPTHPQAQPDATVEVKISDDLQDVAFDFYNSPFQIHDDAFVLKHMAQQQQLQRPHLGAPGADAPTLVMPGPPKALRESDGGFVSSHVWNNQHCFVGAHSACCLCCLQHTPLHTLVRGCSILHVG